MFLYNLTLQKSTFITKSVVGNFSGYKQQEIVLAKNNYISIVKPDIQTGKLVTLAETQTFGIIRDISVLRQVGSTKDYIVVSSDSGAISLLEFDPKYNTFAKLHQEVFGKSGCRRSVAGEYLATDPKGRAVMVAAVEKCKFVYVFNRTTDMALTISSPLEAHRSHTLLFCVVALDVGYDNPVFACLEVEFNGIDEDVTGKAYFEAEKQLLLYELDLGLNHVVRKSMDSVPNSAHLLIAVPGGDGPGGVIVCCDGWLQYINNGITHRIPIPIRHSLFANERRPLVNVYVVHRLKDSFFVLFQTDLGDVFKVEMTCEGNLVSDVVLSYFDTLPLATSISILKSGFIFVACESGNHSLFQIETLSGSVYEFHSADYLSVEGENVVEKEIPEEVLLFEPTSLKNIVAIEESELQNLAPITTASVLNLTNDESPQFYAFSGRGHHSALRTIKHGLKVSELACSELPGNPQFVFTTRQKRSDPFDSFIIISFLNATLVLSIGETVEEVTNTGIRTTEPTIAIHQMGPESIVQITPSAVLNINNGVTEWKVPEQRIITHAAVNDSQLVISLNGGELRYFELEFGRLVEHHVKKFLTTETTSLAIGSVPRGKKRSRFFAVASLDLTVRVMSLDPDTVFDALSMQAVTAIAESLSIVRFNQQSGLELLIGLSNGVLMQSCLDDVTGTLSDTRARYLGAKGVQLCKVLVNGGESVLAMSTKAWLNYAYQGKLRLTPLDYPILVFGSSFHSEQCNEGMVAIAENTLRIMSVDDLDNVLNQTVTPLSYTPRKAMHIPGTVYYLVIESENNTLSQEEQTKIIKRSAEENMMDEEDVKVPDSGIYGLPRYENKWASLYRIINPTTGQTLFAQYFLDNEAAFSIGACVFYSNPNEMLIMIGTAKNTTVSPRTCTCGFIYTFRLDHGGNSLSLLHKTPVDDIPMALIPFQGRLLAGVGRKLRVYDLGKKKLLRKCESRAIPNLITSLQTQGDRVIVTDVSESIFFASFYEAENKFVVYADDFLPRYVTASLMLDYHTVAVADKFGSFAILRLRPELTDEIESDPGGNKIVYERGRLNGAPYKCDLLCQYFVGDTITSLHKSSLISGGKQVLVYTTLLGSIGIFIPFTNHDDVEFFQYVELHMRQMMPPLLGRDHLAFRSYYLPVKGIVDGDLCEMWSDLSAEKQEEIAGVMDRDMKDIGRQIEEMRHRVAF